eukprot:COSAG01_NODE_107_length_25964_cov_174.577576_5_plen_70_part_00
MHKKYAAHNGSSQFLCVSDNGPGDGFMYRTWTLICTGSVSLLQAGMAFLIVTEGIYKWPSVYLATTLLE